MTGPRTNIEAIGLVAGFGLWSLAFVALYAVHGYACGSGAPPGDPTARAAMVALFAAFLVAHGWLAWWFARRWKQSGEGPVRFIRLASLVLAIAAAGTTIWTGLPVLTLSICA
ncbi:MAG TPA: hypothetical protein VM346_05940 [Sphingomicrobium sp.]|nr:hypothetical protein [Sphingomicrobium sp.]